MPFCICSFTHKNQHHDYPHDYPKQHQVPSADRMKPILRALALLPGGQGPPSPPMDAITYKALTSTKTTRDPVHGHLLQHLLLKIHRQDVLPDLHLHLLRTTVPPSWTTCAR